MDKNFRQTLLQIGKNIRLPKSVVDYRIKKLEEAGIIKNSYTVINFYKFLYINIELYVNYQYFTKVCILILINIFLCKLILNSIFYFINFA